MLSIHRGLNSCSINWELLLTSKLSFAKSFLYPLDNHYLVCSELLLMTMVVLSTVSHTATTVNSCRGFRRCSNFIELISQTHQSVRHLRDGIIDGREFLIYDPDKLGHILLEVLTSLHRSQSLSMALIETTSIPAKAPNILDFKSVSHSLGAEMRVRWSGNCCSVNPNLFISLKK